MRRWLILGGVALAGMAAWRIRGARHALDLRGRTVLIIGGSRGLGLALAREFAAHGATLGLVARSEPELGRAANDLAARGARVAFAPADVRHRTELEAAITKIAAQLGGVDVLVNNAGIITVGPLRHMTLNDYIEAMAVHYWGPLYAVLAALPYLRRSPAGRIVNIASIGGKVAVPHLAPYSGSKFALVGLSDALRAELAEEGIRVTTVVPGLMRTGSPRNATYKGRHGAEYAWFSVSDALPLLSVSAETAARAIVNACRTGAPSLTIGLPARLATMAQGVAPSLVGKLTVWAAALLPSSTGQSGTHPKQGFQTRPSSLLRFATALNDRAAERHNQSQPAPAIRDHS